MNLPVKAAVAAAGSLAAVGMTAGIAHADSDILFVGKYAHLSATHNIMLVPVWVTCSEDTTSASLSATVTQITNGGVQQASGNITSIGAFECSGDEERVYVPVRRPTGGFRWVTGTARVSNVVFATDDPNPGINIDFAKGRSVNVVK